MATSRTPPRASSSRSMDDFDVISVASGQSTTTQRSMAPSMASTVTGQDLVTDQVLRLVGPPPQCEHHETTKLYVCRKQGHNYKRIFWRCPRQRGSQCATFIWSEIQPYLDPIYQDDLEPEDYAPDSPRSMSGTPVENILMELQKHCPHTKVDKRGTNPYKIMVKCATCGKVLKSEKTELAKQMEEEKNRKKIEPDYQEFLEWKKSGACRAGGIWTDQGPTPAASSRKKP